MHEDRRYWTAQDLQRRASAALARAAANGVTHLRTHIDWFTADAPDAWREIARLAHPGVCLERVALVPLGLFADPAAAEAIAQAVADSGEGCLLGGFVHSSNWDPRPWKTCCAARWRLDLDLHIDEELNDHPGAGLAGGVPLPPCFSGHICCSHGAPRQRQRGAGGEDPAPAGGALRHPYRPADDQPAATGCGDWPHAAPAGITLLQEARSAGVATLLGCDNVQDAFCPAGSYDPLDTLACGLFSAQLSDVFDRQSRLICDRAALTLRRRRLRLSPSATRPRW